jgi:hypothetical protein
MEVRVRDIVAQCARCTGSQFEAMTPGAAATLQPELECTQCGYRYTRAELVGQIAEEALRRSRAARGTGRSGNAKR